EAFTQARDALARNPRYPQTPTFEAPDPSRIAYLAEVGGTGPGLPPRKTNWADRRPWFAAGVATLAVATCAGWLYVERWPWLDARLCAWRAASCEPAQAALAVVTGQLREAERHYEALDRARGQAAAEAAAARVVADQARTSLSAALAAAEQATARATEAERRVQEATAARDTALAEARQAAARSAAAEGASGSAMVALRQERDAAQGRAAATERDLALAQAQARQAASQSTAAEAQVEALRRDLASVRAEAGRLGQALAAEQTAGREKDARIATLSQQRPANTAATIPNATPQLERHPRPETATGGIPNQPYAPPDRIMIRSEDRVWLLVYDNQSGRIFSNQFSSNISYLVPDAPNLVLRTNDVSKLSVEIGGRGINILEGASGGRRELSLNVESLTSSRGRPDNVAEYVPLSVFFGYFGTDWKRLPNRTEILQKYREAVRRPPTDERSADFWHDLGRDLNILGFS
ncbi:MAG: hypothetical protein O9325_09160, partial [Roseomonas sp.]|nr:hypothetical protein [Roseomonas sp.]